MCLIGLEELKRLERKTLIFFAAELDDQAYIEDSFRVVADQSLNELVNELRKLDITEFPIVCYDSEDLFLASKAYWILEAMDYSVKILVISRGLHRPVRSLGPIPYKEEISHIDITRISNSVLYETQEFFLVWPIVANLSKNLCKEQVEKFLQGQKIPIETNGIQLTGLDAEQIGVLLKYLERDVTVKLTEVKTRTKTVISKYNETFVSAAGTVYFDAEEDKESLKSENLIDDAEVKDRDDSVDDQHFSQTEKQVEEKDGVGHYNAVMKIGSPMQSKRMEDLRQKQCFCCIF